MGPGWHGMIAPRVGVPPALISAEESAEKPRPRRIRDACCVYVPRARATSFSMHSARPRRRGLLLICLVSSARGFGALCLVSSARGFGALCLVSSPRGFGGAVLSKQRAEKSTQNWNSFGLLTKHSSKQRAEKNQHPFRCVLSMQCSKRIIALFHICTL